MTIAVGFTCNEGIVLCTDSQETISYVKQEVGKIHILGFQNCFIGVAGAGESDYIAMAIEKITNEAAKCKNFNQVVTKLEEVLLTFFDRVIARWSSFSSAERPAIELLIAVAMRGDALGLFHFAGTAFHRVSSKAIGAGVLLANQLVDDYCFGNHTLEELAKLAAYLVFRVKRQVDGCGGFTNMIVLRKNRDIAFVESKEVEEFERELAQKENEAVSELKGKILSLKGLRLEWLSEHK